MRFFRLQNAVMGLSLLTFSGFAASSMAPLAYGQTNTTGDIAGVVSDSSGAAIANATVSVTNLATGAIRVATTGAAGEYRVSQLAPGRYTVTIAASGFEKTKATYETNPNSVTQANLVLTVGKANETVGSLPAKCRCCTPTMRRSPPRSLRSNWLPFRTLATTSPSWPRLLRAA